MDDFEANFIDTGNVCLPLRSGTCDENAGRKDDRIIVCGDEGKEVKREDKDLVCSEKLTGGIIKKDMKEGRRKQDEVRRKGMEEEVRREEKNINDEEGEGTSRKREKAGDMREDELKEPVKEDGNKEEKVEHCILTGADSDEGDHILPGTDDDGREQLHHDQNGGSNYMPNQEAVVINVTHRGAGTDDSSCTTQTTDDDTDTDSDLSSVSTRAAYMLPDSEDGFDMVRTLRHYRRRRSSDSSTTDSNCSCKSCVSRTNWSFFSTEEGPPGGEGTIYRRAAIWLESIKYLWGILIYGLLAMTVMFTGSALWAMKQGDKVGYRIFPYTLPPLVIVVTVIIVWQVTWYVLLKKGYGKGDQTVDRKNIILCAQRRKLVYTVRGAIYAPTKPNPKGRNKPPLYEVVSYESEYDSSKYFDSDLEADGQYKKTITPWKDLADPVTREKRNIYTRKAWFRDVPIVWWEVCTEPPRDI